MTVGDRIKQKRASLGWSRTRLAKETEIPYSTIAGIENGDARSSTNLPIIAAALGVDSLWLAAGQSKSQLGDSSTLLPTDERKLLSIFRSLVTADKQILMRVARGLVGKNIEP